MYIKQKNVSGIIFTYVVVFLITSVGFGNLIIDYSPLDPINLTFYILCFVLFAVGAFLGERLRYIFVRKIPISLSAIIRLCTWLSLIGVVVCWYYNIKYWGSISYIISHAMLIREKMIGGNADFIPTSWSYLASLSYLGFIASLFLFNKAYVNQKLRLRTKVYYVAINFILVVLLDMVYFGRIGAVFSLLTLIAYLISFYPISKLLNKKTILLFLMVLVLVNVPRMIRGGGDLFLASMDDKIKSVNVPVNVYTAGPIINYIYYFSSPYSFNEWMDKDFGKTGFTYGARTLTPFYNIMQKFYGESRITIIDEDAYIPFRHNIFSVVKDYYCDFGILGVIFIPLLIGGMCGRAMAAFYISQDINKTDFSYGLLGVFFLSYILYAPIYNILSFGKFFIPLIIILLLSYLFRVK